MAVKSMGCSFCKPKFNSQRPHDISLLSVAPVLGRPDALFWLLGVMHALGAQAYIQAKFPYTKQNGKSH